MENDYTQLTGQMQSFIDLLGHQHDDSEATGADGPHMERIDFDRLRDVLTAVREKLEAAQRLDSEMHALRRRLMGRIEALRRSGKLMADDGRPGNEALPANDISLDELLRIYDEETSLLHYAAASRKRAARSRHKVNRDYNQFK